MDNSVNERLKLFIKSLRISVNKFEVQCGLSSSYVNNIKKPSFEAIDKIKKVYPQLNDEWLLTGEGDMILFQNKSVAEDITSYVPLLPIAATGGPLTDFTDGVIPTNCEQVRSPFDRAELAVPIRGDSMSPEYPNGSIVFVRRINPDAFVEWGKVYVLCTCNGDIVKEVHPADDRQHIICRSLNPFKPVADFQVLTTDIYSWWIVLGCVSRK